MTRFAAFLALSAGLACGQQTRLPDPPPPGTVATQPKAAAKLQTGDAAPMLAIDKWLKGDPVASFELGHVYVIEFWATWCAPCIASMPHLSEIQRTYKDQNVTVIGVTTQDPRNTLSAAERMVREMNDAMSYTVAWDKGLTTARAFMEASRQGGIPCSFVIDKMGKIAYIGHPMFLEGVLPGVLAGTWNYKDDAARLEQAQTDYFALYEAQQKSPQEGLKAIADFESKYPAVAEVAWEMKYGSLLKAGDAQALTVGAKLFERFDRHKNADGLNELAWSMVDPESNVPVRDLEFALKAASQATALAQDKNPEFLDTLARVYFVKGDKAKAIETETRARDAAAADDRARFEKTLAEYSGAK